MTDSSGPDAPRPWSAYDHRQKNGTGWQDHGPVLRNWSPRAPFHSRFFEPLEAIIWIATRDEAAICGANGYVAGGVDRTLQPNPRACAQIVVEQFLPNDVAGHHLECGRFVPDVVGADGEHRAQPPGICTCTELGRVRYCRCANHLHTDRWSCTCTPDAEKALLDAIHRGMPIYGRRPDEEEFIDVPRAALAGMAIQFDEHGLTLLPSFEQLRIPIDEIKRRWPADFSDLPMNPPTIKKRAPGVVKSSRPNKADAYLTLFCERLSRGQTKPSKPEEKRAIRLALRSSNPKDDTIDKAIRPFWGDIVWGDDGTPVNAIDVIAKVRAKLGQ